MPLRRIANHRTMRAWVAGGALLGLLALGQAGALTLQDLRNDQKLSPRRFAGHFEDFKYVFREGVQPPEVFLTTRAGDCDDYATLADLVLHEKGYHTRLIHVRMPGVVAHCVCYVTEETCYLDYNNRVYVSKLASSGPTLREIAAKVAKSLDANWTSASEFTFDGRLKRLVVTVVKTDPPERDPAPGRAASQAPSQSAAKINLWF